MKPTVSKYSVRLVGLVLFAMCFSASAEEADTAKDILKKMNAEIVAMQKFVITADGYTDAREPIDNFFVSTRATLLLVKAATPVRPRT